MKLFNKKLIIVGGILAFTSFMVSCEKGKDLDSPGYGKLSVLSTFGNEEKPLLIKVDGETKDTLNLNRPISQDHILVPAGNHQVSLVNTENNKTLLETQLLFETRKTVSLPRFWYREGALLLDDYDPVTMQKPGAGNILVRFVNVDKDLPADMRLEIVVYYKIGRSYFKAPTGITIAKVTKGGFSEFLELPDWKSLAPSGALYCTVEGYDNATGEQVLGADRNVGSRLSFDGVEDVYTPNMVYSMAIESYTTSTVFSQQVK